MAKYKKHTPITTKKQARWMGWEYGKGKKGEAKESGMSQSILKKHLEEWGRKKNKKRKK